MGIFSTWDNLTHKSFKNWDTQNLKRKHQVLHIILKCSRVGKFPNFRRSKMSFFKQKILLLFIIFMLFPTDDCENIYKKEILLLVTTGNFWH